MYQRELGPGQAGAEVDSEQQHHEARVLLGSVEPGLLVNSRELLRDSYPAAAVAQRDPYMLTYQDPGSAGSAAAPAEEAQAISSSSVARPSPKANIATAPTATF